MAAQIGDWLDGFENRMKFINIVRYLLGYKYPDSIRTMIPDRQVLDNLAVAVLLYIKERTLGDEQRCTLEQVEDFLMEFAPTLPEDCRPDCKLLARHLIVEVLQHGGELAEYPTWNSERTAFERQSVRLIHEEKGAYHVTDDAFDFLFRTKEIESELDYSVTRFRMKEYMKRNNYSKALEQSRELVSRIRQMMTRMDDFLLRCRENLSAVTIDAYEEVVQGIRNLLTDEESELKEIQRNARERRENLELAHQSGVSEGETRKHRAALDEIVRNISTTILEQRKLINKRFWLREQYGQILQDQYMLERYERMNFERDIMAPLRKLDGRLGVAAKFLLFPLSKPELQSVFSLENFYAPQSSLSKVDSEEGIELHDEGPDPSAAVIQRRNERFRKIFLSLFSFLSHQDGPVSSRQYAESLAQVQLDEFCMDNALPNTFLELYAIGTIDISAWKASDSPIPEPMGELEVAWCLRCLPEELLRMRMIRVTKLEGTFTIAAGEGEARREIEITDLEFEVVGQDEPDHIDRVSSIDKAGTD